MVQLVIRDTQLMCPMYELSQKKLYEKVLPRNTRAAERYTFHLNQVNIALYQRSPYYLGHHKWNNLPMEVQNAQLKIHFKQSLPDVI